MKCFAGTLLLIFFACAFVEGDISKNMKLFSKAIFYGLVRFVKSSLRVDVDWV